MFEFKRTELESRSKEESDNKAPPKYVGNLKMRKVKQTEDSRGLHRTRDAHSARLQECDENIDVAKQLNWQQVKKLAVISKPERSTADQSPYNELYSVKEEFINGIKGIVMYLVLSTLFCG